MKLKTRPQLWDDIGVGGCFYWDYDVQHFADCINIVNPTNILETGFFAGSSAFFWLYLSDATLTSVDPMENLYNPAEKHTGKLENVEKIQNAFPNRFTFLKKDSKLVRPDLVGKKFDLFFIDGDHWENGIRNDFQLALDFNIPWIFVDDFVTDVENMYYKEFQKYFTPVRSYNRKDTFMGKPIPIMLFKNNNFKVLNLAIEF